ncbi:hypothetical protein RB2234 [Rhodopirellula baltica SH 1]|uniref:Uncharacterized protein n=1 Tax=Rhodopirellula baltica (strain DSM 10527 / NCIMB 13988 / SH1) TaxID=243090 RepID=Q7UW69_RHOBA|nr:hypothetical protein RB2234 [Rhodopirellula baltica SH 1]
MSPKSRPYRTKRVTASPLPQNLPSPNSWRIRPHRCVPTVGRTERRELRHPHCPRTHPTEFLANPATSLRPNSRPYRTE